jgi:hypothetical protein
MPRDRNCLRQPPYFVPAGRPLHFETKPVHARQQGELTGNWGRLSILPFQFAGQLRSAKTVFASVRLLLLLRFNIHNFLFVLHRLSPFVRNGAFGGRHTEAASREPASFFVNF